MKTFYVERETKEKICWGCLKIRCWKENSYEGWYDQESKTVFKTFRFWLDFSNVALDLFVENF